MDAHQILFVEDDLVMSLAACEFIRDRGIRVIAAGDALSAAIILDKRGYISGLVSDIDLGVGEDGFEVARRARAAYPGLLVVFVSGAAAARHELEGVEGSIFIEKPYHPRQIVEAIAMLSARAQVHGGAPSPAAPAGRMMPSTECIDRAVEAERRSAACTDQITRDGFANLGRTWRHVARQAEWQDAFALGPPERFN